MNQSRSSCTIAVIGGTGFEKLTAFSETGREVVKTPYGDPSSALIHGIWSGTPVCFLSRHAEDHSIPPHRINYRANIHALKSAGINQVVGLAATGGITGEMATGAIVLPDQLIDYTWGREHTFFDGTGQIGELISGDAAHIEFTSPYDEMLRQSLLDAAASAGIEVHSHGVYGVTQGPRLETSAEINRMQKDGVDVVGMTGLPEASLARELGMRYSAIAMVVNAAAGKSQAPITMDLIRQNLKNVTGKVEKILDRFMADYSAGQTPSMAPNMGWSK